MKPANPEIGIALAVYEPAADFFLEQLLSIQAQEGVNFVCFLTFDSKIPVWLNSKEFEGIIHDERFRLIQNHTRLGHKKNFEYAAKLILDEYPAIPFVAFCDQDDIWYPQKLFISLSAIATLPPYSGVQTDMHIFVRREKGFSVLTDGRGKPRSGWEFERKIPEYHGLVALISNNHVAGTAMMIRSEVIRDYGAIPDTFEFHDHWYGLVCTLLGQLKAIPTPCLLYRQHGQNVAGASEGAGLITIREQAGVREALRECCLRFGNCQLRVKDLSSRLRRPYPSLSFIYLSPFDFGLGFAAVFFVLVLRGDFRRARSVLSMWIGKIFWIFSLQGRLDEEC